jgi:hypothetical protein
MKLTISIIITFPLILFACSTTPLVQKIYIPQDTIGILSYYENGVPFCVLSADSNLIMMSLGTTDIVGYKYMQLWLFYQNNNNSTFLLDPIKIVRLNITGTDNYFADISPDKPTTILNHIDDEKATENIMSTIGGALQLISTEPTKISDHSGHAWTVNDKKEKQNQIVNSTIGTMVASSSLYDSYKNSVSSGVLRRNTLLPGKAVNGYIYFPIPQIPDPVTNNMRYLNVRNSKFQLIIETPAGLQRIMFVPGDDE